MADIALITPPAAEPVQVSDMVTQLGLPTISDPTLSSQQTARLTRFISAARRWCENYTRRAFITQTWLLKLDGWPPCDWRYNWRGYPTIVLPYPPCQSIYWLRYVDTFGAVQTLPLDTSYGNAAGQYGYQFKRGDDVQPGRLISAWARPWPPVRMVPANVLVQIRAGYGGPVTGSMGANSAVLSGPVFNPDDAPLMTGDTGLQISVPGAGANGAALATTIASVDANGQATLADAAVTAVSNASVWAGWPVPEDIVDAIILLAQYYWEQGAIVDQAQPRVVADKLDSYVNRVS